MANNKNLIGLTINDTYIARPFAICPSMSISPNKAVSWPGFNLTNGATILVKFTYENNADNITLDVNGTGAIPILYRGEQIIKTNKCWASDDIIEFRYDGVGWHFIGKFNNYVAGEGIIIESDENSNVTQKISVDKEWLDNILKDYVTLEYVNNTFLKLEGGTITGDLTVNGNTHFQEKYVVEDDLNNALNDYLLKSGGTITGNLSVNGSTMLNNLTVNGDVIADAFYEVVDDASYQTSDERLKDFGDDVKVDFRKLKALKKKYFTWKDGDNTQEIGISAQELQKIYPELVKTDIDGYLKVDYSKLSVISLVAIDKLLNENNSLKKSISNIENRLLALENK